MCVEKSGSGLRRTSGGNDKSRKEIQKKYHILKFHNAQVVYIVEKNERERERERE